MALSKEDLLAISQLLDSKLDSKLEPIEKDISNIKSDVNNIKSDVNNIKSDLNNVKRDVSSLKSDVNNIKLHLENVTDRNIQLLAENYIELINKLNQAIPFANNNIAYEVKVNYLVGEIDNLKKELTDLKSKIA